MSIVGLFFALIAGCHSLELKSIWTSSGAQVDGKNSDWQGVLTALDDRGTSVGFMNDERFDVWAVVQLASADSTHR